MKTEYKELLKDPRWQEKRKAILERDGYRCQYCGSEKNLEVHHYNYDAPTPWDVGDMFLITLCHECHNRYHKPLGVPGVYIPPQQMSIYFDYCSWYGFSKERMEKEGFVFFAESNHAMLRLGGENGFVLFVTHQGEGSNLAFVHLYKKSYSKKVYHEAMIVGQLMLEDYLEDYLNYKPWEQWIKTEEQL